MTRERDVERYLVERVRDAGGEAYKFTSPGRSRKETQFLGVPLRMCDQLGIAETSAARRRGKRCSRGERLRGSRTARARRARTFAPDQLCLFEE